MAVVDVPGVKLGEQVQRPGYEILVPGECLKVGSKLWTDEQRASGVWLRMVYLTSTEEEEVLKEAAREGTMAVANAFQVRRSLADVAPNVPETVEADGEPVVRPAPGSWKRIPPLERRAVWEELGPQGRNFAIYAFNQANNPSEVAREAATKSFRLSG